MVSKQLACSAAESETLTLTLWHTHSHAVAHMFTFSQNVYAYWISLVELFKKNCVHIEKKASTIQYGIGNVGLMHECFPKHWLKGTARMK